MLFLILLQCILYSIGYFFNDANYDDETNMIVLEFKEGIYTYQQVAVMMTIVVYISLIIIKAFHIYYILAPDHLHHNQVSYHCQKVHQLKIFDASLHKLFLCKYVHNSMCG